MAVAFAYLFQFFYLTSVAPTSLAICIPIDKYVQVKSHVIVHIRVAVSAYNND